MKRRGFSRNKLLRNFSDCFEEGWKSPFRLAYSLQMLGAARTSRFFNAFQLEVANFHGCSFGLDQKKPFGQLRHHPHLSLPCCERACAPMILPTNIHHVRASAQRSLVSCLPVTNVSQTEQIPKECRHVLWHSWTHCPKSLAERPSCTCWSQEGSPRLDRGRKHWPTFDNHELEECGIRSVKETKKPE